MQLCEPAYFFLQEVWTSRKSSESVWSEKKDINNVAIKT